MTSTHTLHGTIWDDIKHPRVRPLAALLVQFSSKRCERGSRRDPTHQNKQPRLKRSPPHTKSLGSTPSECLKGCFVLFCRTIRSVAAVAKANCLRIGLALGNNFFNTAVKRLALLLHSAEAKSDCCQGDSREDSGRNLNNAIGKHRVLLTSAVFLRAAGFFACVLVGHRKGITQETLWTGNVPSRHVAAGITAQRFRP